MTENKEVRYISIRIVDKKPRKVIVDENGKIININPSKDELKGFNAFPKENYKRNPRKNYTDDELLSELRRFEKKYGLPKTEDFTNNLEYPNYQTYIKRFGSWNKALEKAFDIKRNRHEREIYTDNELLSELRRFEKKYGRPPTEADFINSHEYPNFMTYVNRFGNWNNSLIKAELNIDLTGRRGNIYRGRQVEIAILKHLENKAIDLAGENHNNYCDGIFNGELYDVKSSKLIKNTHYKFTTRNKDKGDDIDAISWYYFVAVNDDNKIKYIWMVPGDIVEKDYFVVGLNPDYEFNVENMEEYNITEKFKNSSVNENKKMV